MAKGGNSNTLTIVLPLSRAIGILLRGIAMIAAMLVIVCAAVNLVDLNIPIQQVIDAFGNFLSEDILTSVPANHDKTKALSIWMVVLASVTLLLEIPLIVIQFFNFGSNTIVIVVDTVISFVLAVAFFCGAVPAAVYTNVWSGIKNDAVNAIIISVFNLDRIATSTGATAAFGFISVILFILLALWVIISQCSKSGKQGKHSKTAGNDQKQSEMEKR